MAETGRDRTEGGPGRKTDAGGEPERASDFAALVAHDLKAPIRSILGFADLLGAEAGASLSGPARVHLRRLQSVAERLRALVDGLERFTRVPELTERSSADLGEALRAAVDALDADIRASGATVVADDLPVVPGDPVLLGDLFQNLVANAICHRGERTPRVDVDCERQGQEWLVAIRDNGPGVPAEDRDRIFEPFARLGSATEGSGLGLAIARRIVEAHDGEIWVESDSGRGSAFFFTLPA